MFASKYACSKSSEILGNSRVIKEIKGEILKFEENREFEPNVWLLFGGTGSGKTSIANTVLKEAGYQITSFDACFKRSAKMMKSKVNDIVLHKHFENVAIVFDEFEHIIEENVGASVLIDFLKQIVNIPIFIVSNNNVSARLLKVCTKFSFNKHTVSTPSKEELQKHLMNIVKRERLKIPTISIKRRIDHNSTDIRKLINELSTPENIKCCGTTLFSKVDNLSTVNTILMSDESLDMKIKAAEADIFASVPIVHENYISICDPKYHKTIAHLLSLCDIIHTYVYVTQSWSLLYVPVVCGVVTPCSMSQKKRVNKYGTILSKISNAQTKEKTIAKLYTQYSVSTIEQLHAIKLLSSIKQVKTKNTAQLKSVINFD